MKKKLLILVIVFLLMCIGSFVVFKLTKEKKNNKDTNDGNMIISEDIQIHLLENMELDEYEVEDLIFKDVLISVSEGKDSFQATMMNRNARDKLKLEVILYNKEGKKVETLEFEFLDLEENDERSVFCMTDSDLYDSYSFKVKVK